MQVSITKYKKWAKVFSVKQIKLLNNFVGKVNQQVNFKRSLNLKSWENSSPSEKCMQITLALIKKPQILKNRYIFLTVTYNIRRTNMDLAN